MSAATADACRMRCGSAASSRTSRQNTSSFRVPWGLSSVDRADTVIVTGIDDLDRPIPDSVLRAIRHAIDRSARVASICTGVLFPPSNWRRKSRGDSST